MTMDTKDPLHIPAGHGLAVELIAVLVAVIGEAPHIMTIRDARALPSGPFESGHRSLQSGLRAWVEQQTGHPIGYMEQLYTFADRDRGHEDNRAISISYLGLTREENRADARDSEWRDWYDYFPWEDHRRGTPELFEAVVAPRLRQWAGEAAGKSAQAERWQRAAITFGLDEFAWNEELVLQRYELLYEAGLVTEAGHGGKSFETGGRPAKLFRFRQAVLAERAAAGTKLPLLRP